MWNEFTNKFLSLPAHIYAPTVALIIFFLGLLFKWVYALFTSWNSRLATRRMIKDLMKDLSFELKKQARNYEKCADQFTMKPYANFILPISEIYAYDLFDQIGLKTIFEAFRHRVVWLTRREKYFLRSKKDRHNTALKKLMALAATNKIWHKKSKQDLEDFQKRWDALQSQWNIGMEKVMKTIENWFVNMDKIPGPVQLAYMKRLDEIYFEWSKLEDNTTYSIVYHELVKKAWDFSKQKEHLKFKPIHQFAFELREVAQVYDSMVNLLSAYNKLYRNYHSGAKRDSKMLRIIDKWL